LIPKIVKNLVYCILVPLAMIFLGLYVIFQIMMIFPGDPVLAYLPSGPYTQEQYDAVKQMLGFNDPLIFQFFRFILQILSWDWGFSDTIAKGMPVYEMVTPRIIRSLDFTVWPIIFGIVVGLLLGILSVKIRYKFVKFIFQILIILGISVPIFYIGLSSQLVLGHILGLFPTTMDPVLPGIILFIITALLMTRQFRSNFVDVKERHYLPSNVLKLCFNINLIFAASLVLEAVFNLNGLGNILFTSIYNQDYYVFRTVISIMLFLILIPILISALSFTVYSFLIEDIKWK
jgi:ABC-type dipeptide/oligopeptide/nickel transport system permease component